MPEYTVLAVLAAVAVVLVELRWFRTGLFRSPAYHLTMAVTFGFQVLVDGWLTKESAPIVLYSEEETSGLRVPWDVPVEDYLFGFALLTLVLLLWVRAGDPDDDGRSDGSGGGRRTLRPVPVPVRSGRGRR